MASRTEERRHWKAELERWHASGKSMRAYCREHEVSCWRLARWRRRIEGAATSKPLTLIPVVGNRTGGGGAIVVRLRSGIGIEVEPGFDPGLLSAVVRALEDTGRC